MIDTRASITIFRDCLKMVPKMVDQPNKIQAVRRLVRNEFEKHRLEEEPSRISSLKMNAAKGISNYLIYTIQQEMKLNPNLSAFEPESSEESSYSEEELAGVDPKPNKP